MAFYCHCNNLGGHRGGYLEYIHLEITEKVYLIIENQNLATKFMKLSALEVIAILILIVVAILVAILDLPILTYLW